MAMRKSNLYFLYLAINIFLMGVIFAHASHKQRTKQPLLREKEDLVKRLELTDLCLVTEASYTRHLSQADLHTPFQDSPLALEHFPSGSIFQPPLAIKKGWHGKLD